VAVGGAEFAQKPAAAARPAFNSTHARIGKNTPLKIQASFGQILLIKATTRQT
jgi:hypothetical protein